MAFAEPARDVVAFVVGPEFAMSTTRRDDHAAARGFVRQWQIRREAGFVDVGEDAFAALGDADFRFAGLAFRAGRAIRPEKDFFAGLYGGEREGEQQEAEKDLRGPE